MSEYPCNVSYFLEVDLAAGVCRVTGHHQEGRHEWVSCDSVKLRSVDEGPVYGLGSEELRKGCVVFHCLGDVLVREKGHQVTSVEATDKLCDLGSIFN